jgi:hypothetical protein
MKIVTHNTGQMSQLGTPSSPPEDRNEDKGNDKNEVKNKDKGKGKGEGEGACESSMDNHSKLNLNDDILTADGDTESMNKDTTRTEPSPLVISISQSPFWLPSELHRRLSLGPVPSLHASEAGTASAVLFTENLLEDVSRIRTPNSKTNTFSDGFQGFLSVVIDLANLIET